MSSQLLKYLLNVPHVFLSRFVEYNNIIQVHNDKRVKEKMKNIIHEPHECSLCISQPKRHDQPLEKTLPHFEGCLPRVLLLYPHLMISTLEINLGKELGTLQLLQQVINARKWTSVLNYYLVDCPIVNTHAPRTILLRH